MEEKILYDPTGFAAKIKQELSNYFLKNPEVKAEWQAWNAKYLERKSSDRFKSEEAKAREVRHFKDQLEIKYSEEHKVTRDVIF